MKLHLPKALLLAVLAVSGVTQMTQAAVGWHVDNFTGGHIYYYDGTASGSTVAEIVAPTSSNGVSISGNPSAADAYTNLYMCVDLAGNVQRTVNKFVLADGQQLTICSNPWKDYGGTVAYYGLLDIDELEIGGGTGSGVLNLLQAESTVNIDSVSGILDGVTNSGKLTIGTEESATTLGGTITNSGTFTLNGDIVLANDLSGITLIDAGSISYSNTTDGYITRVGATHLLVDNNGGTVTMNATTATYGGNVVDLVYDENTGDVTFVGESEVTTEYALNTVDATVGGDSATADTNAATAFVVSSGRTLTIAGDNEAMTAKQLLLNTTGAGNVTLSTDVTLAANENTQATGKLTVDGVRLTFNGGNDHSGSISSFTSVELDEAYIYFNNNEDTFRNVTVTANGATLELEDMGAADQSKALHFAGTTALNGNLNVLSHWNSQLKFDLLTGDGNVVIDDDARSELLVVTIDGGNNYAGKVHVKQTYGNLSMNVAENAGVNVHYENITGGELNLLGIADGNTITLQGIKGFLTQNSTINADFVISNSTDGSKAGLEIDNGYSNSTNTFAGDVTGSGNLVLNKTGLDNFKQVFSGDVSGWTGKMDVASGTHYIDYTGNATEINNQDIGVRGGSTATVTFNHTAATTVNSGLLQSDGTLNVVLSNTSQEGITFTSDTIAMASLTLNEGTRAAFTGISNLTVTDLNLGASSVLSVGNGVAVADSSASAAMKATGAVTLAGGATVVGGLNLSEATGLTLNGLASGPVTITGDLILGGAPITLSGDVLSALTGLTEGQTLNLFDVSGILSINGTDYDTIADNSYLLSDVFSADEITDSFYLGYQNNMVYAGLVVPEPATASLSLLGLAALMMRRRRVK